DALREGVTPQDERQAEAEEPVRRQGGGDRPEQVVDDDAPARPARVPGRLVPHDPLLDQREKRELEGAQGALAGRLDEDREMSAAPGPDQARAAFGTPGVDPIIVAEGDQAQPSGPMQRQHPLHRLVGNRAIGVHEHRLEAAIEAFEVRFTQMGDDRRDRFVHPQDGVAPGHRGLRRM
ncbi:hypothetical protein LTR94_031962, partial [Friedmanniomyces endolithicus]